MTPGEIVAVGKRVVHFGWGAGQLGACLQRSGLSSRIQSHQVPVTWERGGRVARYAPRIRISSVRFLPFLHFQWVILGNPSAKSRDVHV